VEISTFLLLEIPRTEKIIQVRCHMQSLAVAYSKSGLLPCLLDKLHETGLLIADLAGERSDGLEAKYMGICRRGPGDKVRRIGRSQSFLMKEIIY
jgi:hypothetical protein